MKSCRGEDLDVAEVEPWGLTGDRRWMLVDPTGEVVTAREANRLVLVTPRSPVAVDLSSPGVADLSRRPAAVGTPGGAEICDDRLTGPGGRRDRRRLVLARPSDDRCAWSTWMTHADARSTRSGRTADVVSLADGFPLLLATEESLAQLNAWIADGPRAADGPVPMTRFRPNLIVRGARRSPRTAGDGFGSARSTSGC